MDAWNSLSDPEMKSIWRLARYTVLSLILFALVTSFLWGKNIELTSKPVPQAVKVDGLISDWPEGALSYLSDQDITVGMCNDTQNVYIMLCSRKPDFARVIRMTGLTVYLDVTGEREKNFKLRYFGGPTRDQILAVTGETGGDSSRQISPEARERMQQRDRNYQPKFSCYEKDVIVEKPIPMDGTEGPSAAFAVDKGFFVYEFSVPLATSKVRYYGLGIPPNRKIGIGLIWGEINRDEMRQAASDGGGGDFGQGRPPGGMPPGGVPGGGGEGGWGGRGGGHRGGGEGEVGGRSFRGRELPKKQEVWMKVQLEPLAAATTPSTGQ